MGYADLGTRLDQLAALDHFDPAEPYHYEYIFNPYDKDRIALATSATDALIGIS